MGVGTQIIYVDPENDLVIVARWIEKEKTAEFVRMVLASIENWERPIFGALRRIRTDISFKTEALFSSLQLYSIDGDASNVIYNNITLSSCETIDNRGVAFGPELELPRATNITRVRGVTLHSKRVRQEHKSLAHKRDEVDRYFAAWDDKGDDLH